MANSKLLSKLSISGEKNIIPAVCAFIREIALKEGFSPEEAGKLELVMDEACLNVIEHALKGNENEYFDVYIERRPGQFVMAVEDRGIPMDMKKVEAGEETGLGMILMKNYTDRMNFINLGKGGKRVEFIKEFVRPTFENSSIESSALKDEAPEMAPMDTPITIRLMEPEDSVGLIKCMYNVYGYTYLEFVYFPEKISEMLKEGTLISMVAVAPDGKIIGHQGLKREHKDSTIAEIAMGAVDPVYRGRQLFKKLKDKAFSYIREKGLYGLYGEAVANHAYSQKANNALGGRETGILLGYGPQNIAFKSINEKEEDRITTILFYTRLNEEPERVVYLPFHHQGIIRKIYDYGKFKRIIKTLTPREQVELPEESQVNIKTVVDGKMAFLQVIRYGQNFEELIQSHLKNLCINNFAYISIDLPLANPSTPLFCAGLEFMGFFFAGLIPEFSDGDIFRLQYLNNFSINTEKIVVVSDFGKELFKYTLECWKNS